MRAQRLIATSAVVLMMASGAGCSPAAGGSTSASQPPRAPRPPATIPSDPVAALAAAKAQLGTESARFALDVGSDLQNFTGMVDAETKNWEISGKEYVVRRIGTDLYVRASGKRLESMLLMAGTADHLARGGWARTRLPNGSELSVVFNDKFPWNLANPAASATGITRTGDRSFSGTLSVKEAKYGSRSRMTKNLRLSVDLDDRGRLIRIKLNSDATPDHHTVFTFSDFGVRASITAPPPGDVVEDNDSSFTAGLALF